MAIDAEKPDSRPQNPDPGDRLTGWRDVAAYVGRSVRTAQRWEKIASLPVHRITTPTGEVVYGFRTELDAWIRSRDTKTDLEANSGEGAEDDRPARRRLLLLGSAIGVAVSGVVVFIVLLAVPFAVRAARTLSTSAVDRNAPGPAGWRVEDGRLKVYNARDERIWEYRFPFVLEEHAYAKDQVSPQSLVLIADLENDGGKEVLFIARGKDPADSALFCFDATGAVRFAVQPRQRVRYGDQEYAPPFEVQQIFLTPEPDRRFTLWLVASHHAWFPTVLQKLTHTGDVIAEYWNDGRIDSLREARLGSRRVMLAAGTNVEYAGPSLAVLDYDTPGGAAPADDPRFRCTSCAPASPAAAFVVPFTSVWSEMNLSPGVDDILLSKNGYITLALHGSRVGENREGRRLDMLATFDQGFDVLDVQANEGAATAALRTASGTGPGRQGRLDMFPIFRWLNGHRMPLPAQTTSR